MKRKNDKNIPSWPKFQNWFLESVAGKTEKGAGYVPGKYGKLDYQTVLEDASKTMIRIKKPERLMKMIVRLIDREVGTAHTAALLYKEKQDAYSLVDTKGARGRKIPLGYIKLTPSNPLIKFFIERKNFRLSESGALSLGQIRQIIEKLKSSHEEKAIREELAAVLEQLRLLKADVAVPCYFKNKLLGILILGRKHSKEPYRNQELRFFAALANDAAMALANAQLIDSLQGKIYEVAELYDREHHLFIHISIALAAAIDAKDPYTHGHTERVTHYSLSIAKVIQAMPSFDKNNKFDMEALHIAALLHDIGKIGVPDLILNKRGRLNKAERKKIEEHPIIGATILHPIKELGHHIISGVRSHHERFDGDGYPDGIHGRYIPLIAKVISVADAYDAMTSERPYRRRTMNEETAIQTIRDNKGAQFDPLVVRAFLKAYNEGEIVGSTRQISMNNI